MDFLRHKKIYFVFSGLLIFGSLASLFVFRLNPGIDFTGGSILEVEYQNQRPPVEDVRADLSEFDLGEIYIQPSGGKGLIIRMKDISEQAHQLVSQKLTEGGSVEEKRFESLGPVVGRELKQKTITFTTLALFSIVVYIALAFRRIKRPLSSWRYGVVSLVILFHDIAIPLGIFSVLGKFYGIQITIPVVVALLSVVGYAINNVVVVFDRVRENLIKRVGVSFEETVNKSISQTVSRCVNTSLTTLLALTAIFFFGGVTLKYFSLALIIGIIAGTYSSIFLVGSLLTTFRKYV